MVVAGVAPQLIPEGREPVPVHESLLTSAAAGEVERRTQIETGVVGIAPTLDAVARLEAKIASMASQFEADFDAATAPTPAKTASKAPDTKTSKPQALPE